MNRFIIVVIVGTRISFIKLWFYINKGLLVYYIGCVMIVILFSEYVIGYNKD